MTSLEREKKLRTRIKDLEELLAYHQTEEEKASTDRQKYRNHFIQRFKRSLELVAKNQYLQLEGDNGLIANDVKFIQTVEYFIW